MLSDLFISAEILQVKITPDPKGILKVTLIDSSNKLATTRSSMKVRRILSKGFGSLHYSDSVCMDLIEPQEVSMANNISSIKEIYWGPPSAGFLKANVDAAIRDGLTEVGVVIRNHLGTRVGCAGSFYLPDLLFKENLLLA